MKEITRKTRYFAFPPYYTLVIAEDDIYVESRAFKTMRILRGTDNTHGYLQLSLANGITIAIHRLVAEAVYGPCPKGKEVNHIDGDKLNNRPENLEYVTKSENLQHAVDTGLKTTAIGKEHHLYKHGKFCSGRAAYNEYMRDYMRKRYKKQKNSSKKS